jgi:hypothetical protein
VRNDLSSKNTYDYEIDCIKKRLSLDFCPCGFFTRGERVYITDWSRASLYIYKNGCLETKISNNQSNKATNNTIKSMKYQQTNQRKKLFSRPRNIVLDSLNSILVTDLDSNTFYLLDNKGVSLFDTKLPEFNKPNEEMSVFGVVSFENKIAFTTNKSIYVCSLLNY